jgi:hypothetical protein
LKSSVILAIGLCAVVLATSGCRIRPTDQGGSDAGPVSPVVSLQPATNARFVDVTQQAGINYRWSVSGTRPLNLLQTIGNGCAFLDYDNDGNLDVLLVGPHLALYKGDGHGHFTDVTHQTRLDTFHGNFLGCAVGDYDNDGYDDIYLCAYRGGILLHNEHGKYFTDATARAGTAPQPWGTACAFFDLDGSGRLSLYIGNYVSFGPDTRPQLCLVGGVKTACGPNAYRPETGVLYRNMGNGKFRDVTAEWQAGHASGKALGAAAADFDGSGRQSLYLANDEMPGDLLENDGGHFTDIGASAGIAYDATGNKHGGMGADWGDYDNDGRLDLVVATFDGEPKCIYHNDGDDLFTEQSAALGVAPLTTQYVGFGAKWLDYDNDGWLDLMITNGHTQDNVQAVHHSSTYRQPTQLFHNEQGHSFTDASAGLVGMADRPIVGRGLAIGDFDNDGRMDALVVDSEGEPILLHNETPAVGHWLEVRLIGVKSNRDGIGALVTVHAGALTLLRQCTTGGSYMSASDKRVHFGLADATVADRVTIRWPSGHVDTYKDVKPDQIITIREGAHKPISGSAAAHEFIHGA